MGIKNASVVGITGAHGFIGNHLTQHFHDQGIPFVVFEGNLLRVDDIEKFFNQNNISTVIHLVGKMDGSFEDLLSTNVITTQNLLQVGLQFSLKKIIFSSTGAVYGTKGITLSKESDALLPTSLYGASKVYAEEIIDFYRREHNITSIILRFPNIYGQGNNKNVIAKMLGDIQVEKKVYIAGDGEQRRQFLHVLDAVEAITKVLPVQESKILNITNEKDNYSINELAALLHKHFIFAVSNIPVNNNLRNLLMDGTIAKSKIGFVPKYYLPEFINENI